MFARPLAEGVGFEPTESLHPQRFSRPPHSTALPPLRCCNHAGFVAIRPSQSTRDGSAALLPLPIPSIGGVGLWSVVERRAHHAQPFHFLEPAIAFRLGKSLPAPGAVIQAKVTRAAVMDDETVFIERGGPVDDVVRTVEWILVLPAVGRQAGCHHGAANIRWNAPAVIARGQPAVGVHGALFTLAR
jgi:hypothetical protein